MLRRKFIQSAALAATGIAGINTLANAAGIPVATTDYADNPYVIGPLEGYSPQIGTLVSMLNYNRMTIINGTKALTMEQVDYLHDPKSNTIGALIMHLGAVDKWYQVNSFEGRDEFTDAEKKVWNDAMELGDDGRKNIKGKDVKFYLDLITEVREKTLAEFKKRDDKWLLAVDPKFGGGRQQFNTYWKWFHVCEHESNHRGQITWLKGRMPGAKEGGE